MRPSSLNQYWYQHHLHPLLWILLPFSWLFKLIIFCRHKLFQANILSSQKFSVPIIIVGNITVGGTGKTPFVIWLVQWLQQQGYRPGIVSRGVGGKNHSQPHWVNENDKAEIVGDEALLIKHATQVPFVIDRNRPRAVKNLLAQSDCNIVVSDDGLQHYRLARDIEIVMVDGQRKFGNRRLLPAGPLREPIKRLQKVNFVVENSHEDAQYQMQIVPIKLIAINNPQRIYQARKKVHAVAGIGHPERFFTALRKAGFLIHEHIFPDHYLYRSEDFNFHDNLPIIMTEKDAVKCKDFADDRFWFQQIKVEVNQQFQQDFLKVLNEVKL